jgi:glycosyltransferase involved in cell wall biosynthesis
MNIGYDAKRAFFNTTGLGNYSRGIISSMASYFPQNEYFLYSPKPKRSKPFCSALNCHIDGPESRLGRMFHSFWRTYSLAEKCSEDAITLFHGLSNELPVNLHHVHIPAVVTMHDLIFMRYPHLYKGFDRIIYRRKVSQALHDAQKIIAVSKQTADDLIKFFIMDSKKIEVVYQSCNALFWQKNTSQKIRETLYKYNLPEQYLLSVGTIEERKNVLMIIKALNKFKIDIPLIIIGRQTPYYDIVKEYIDANSVKNIYFLHNVPLDDLPSFYQQASIFIYPSFFEGFGIPVLEAIVSGTPVITSKGSCFSEAGGDSSLYVDPESVDEMGEAINSILKSQGLAESMRKAGYKHAQKFTDKNIADGIMDVYRNVQK